MEQTTALEKDLGKWITYDQLEELAFDSATPRHYAKQYLELLNDLKKFIPNDTFRRDSLNTHRNLYLQKNYKIVYSEVGPATRVIQG